jgi:hypothetical protein
MSHPGSVLPAYNSCSEATFESDGKFHPPYLRATIAPWFKVEAFDSQSSPAKALNIFNFFGCD